MNNRQLLTFAAVSGLLAVALGAFGAHGLKSMLSLAQMSAYKTAVDYQLIHTLALLAIVVFSSGEHDLAVRRALKWAALAFGLGIILFSGSLYALALGAPKILGPITPLGGLCFMLGWFSLLIAARRMPAPKK